MSTSTHSINPPILIQSIFGEKIERPPVWCMRQAGRYLPEYQALRRKFSFNTLAETPDLACEITLQPLHRFKELDAAILFADILTPSRALGFDFEFEPGPCLKNPIKSPEDIYSLVKIPVKESVSFVFNALKQIRSALESENKDCRTTEERRALLGFAASPWTLACYLIDQGIYKQHMGTKIFARKYPEEFSHLCSLLSELTYEYLSEKFVAGADAVQIFDTWASLLSSEEYEYFSARWIRPIINRLRNEGRVVVLYVQGDENIIRQSASLKPDVLSVDWRMPLSHLENIIPSNITIQGNTDPTLLFSRPQEISENVKDSLGSLKRRTRYISNLGHGILPGTPIAGMESYLNAVHSAWKI
ncbi:MAG TPA: uroporphyrinogen decarboxylase [Oligoflexia bacterium]|nr:uroporphyrinogen decarboxylase [Oligoflexia bacterium]HMP49009.1 uroporphyrinogen decarboxylase [Oligoflexia bacterium]